MIWPGWSRTSFAAASIRNGRANASAEVARKPSDSRWATSSDCTSRSSSASPPQRRISTGSRASAGLASTASKTFSTSGQRSGIAQLAIEPGPRLLPVQLHGARREPFRFCDLLDGQPTEEPELHGPAEALVEPGEPFEGLVEREHLSRPFARERQLLLELERHRSAATLLRALGSGVGHQHHPHRARGQGEEVRAVLPGEPLAANQLEVALVNQGGGGKRLSDTVAFQQPV